MREQDPERLLTSGAYHTVLWNITFCRCSDSRPATKFNLMMKNKPYHAREKGIQFNTCVHCLFDMKKTYCIHATPLSTPFHSGARKLSPVLICASQASLVPRSLITNWVFWNKVKHWVCPLFASGRGWEIRQGIWWQGDAKWLASVLRGCSCH